MAKHDNRMPIQTALGYVEEARAASRDWRAKSWRDHEMYDGDQWTPEDRQRAVDAGIDPLHHQPHLPGHSQPASSGRRS